MESPDSREYKLLSKTSREFAQKVLLPGREENDRYPLSELNEQIIEKAYELDFFRVWLPEKHGGFGGHLKKLIIILKNIAETDASMAAMILSNTLAQEIIIQAGEQDKLETICSRENGVKDFLISFQAFTNPFETSSMVTAKEKGGVFYLNGEARDVVLGNIAGNALIGARIDGDHADSYFLVSSRKPSFQSGDPIFSLGLHGCPIADIRFHDTEAVMVGEKEKVLDYFQRMYGSLILAGASISAGIMRGSFDDALKYSRKRVQGGRKISQWSELQLLLSDMALKVKNSETIISYMSEQAVPSGLVCEEEIISASIPLFDQACEVTSNGIQVMGGYGYMEDYSQEKRFRDAQHLQSFIGRSYLKKINFMKSFYKLAVS